MLVAAAGNTALQSVMPAIGREIGIKDFYVAIAYTWSAVLWVLLAPYWAEKSDHHGRKTLTMMGVSGLHRVDDPVRDRAVQRASRVDRRSFDLRLFGVFRGIYGGLGCATPSATQAYLASKTRRSGRVAALSALSSSFGLGTIIGPAVAPLFVLPVVGLSGPLFAFALIAARRVLLDRLWLPNDRYRRRVGHGAAMSYPSLACPPTGASVVAATQPRRHKRLSWKDTRIRPWIIAGSGRRSRPGGDADLHRLFCHRPVELTAAGSEGPIAIVMMAGAGATLGAQWGLIPRLGLKPARADPVRRADRRRRPVGTTLSKDLYGITTGFAVASFGFGFTRPGYTAGASLAVPLAEQGAVAGVITSANGISYVLAPALGISMYGWHHDLPFVAFALVLVGLAAARRRRSRRLGLSAGLGPQHAREERSRYRPLAASLRSSASPGSADIRRASPASPKLGFRSSATSKSALVTLPASRPRRSAVRPARRTRSSRSAPVKRSVCWAIASRSTSVG